jgi:hypothetical protein
MHRKTQGLAQIGLFGLALALTACGNEQDAAPDITEAIPLNVDQEGDASIASGNDATAGDALTGDTPTLPSANGEENGAGVGIGDRALPDTMEAGSNPPSFEPPEGSKVQRID